MHLHRTRLHPSSIKRFITSCFDRKLHAVAGMPQCAACLAKFRQWKGLRDHLLSGACPAPERLMDLKDEDARSMHPDVAQLHQLRKDIAALPRHQLRELARRESASLLKHRCLACIETLGSATCADRLRHLVALRREGAAKVAVLHLSPEPRRLNGLASSPAVLIRRGSAASDSEIQSHRAADRRASSL